MKLNLSTVKLTPIGIILALLLLSYPTLSAGGTHPLTSGVTNGNTNMNPEARITPVNYNRALVTTKSYPQDSVRIVSLLAEARKLAKGSNLMLFFGKKFIGTPYVAHTLEVNKKEKLVVNTSQLDCTTFVETCTALTLCATNGKYSFEDYCKALQTIRYYDGKIDGYPSRIHYFSQWIAENTKKDLISEVSSKAYPFTAIQTVDIHYMSRNPQKYAALKANPSFVPIIKAQEDSLRNKSYRYIPRANLKNTRNLRQAVKDGDILAIVTTKDGLDIAHVGIACWHSDGLHLLNASMDRKKVVDEPMTLSTYMKRIPHMKGIRVVRLR